MVTSPMYNPQQQIPTTKINQKKKTLLIQWLDWISTEKEVGSG